jgi:Domain of unknown function (DUF4124)
MNTTRGIQAIVLLALIVVASPAVAQQAYRWYDEQGNVHYAGRRDQVPERYREQLGPERPGDSRPVIGPRATRPPVPGECVLRFRGTERRAGSSQFYPSCAACWKALRAMRGEEATRAECIAASVESYR